jgi:excisionase family DNA binding protein
MNQRELGVSAAAKALNLTLDTVYRLIYAGRIDARKDDAGKWMIPHAAIEERLRQRQMRQVAGLAP